MGTEFHFPRIGRFAAYTVDDPNYDYYLVKVDEQAKHAERTEVIQLDREEFPVSLRMSGYAMGHGSASSQIQQSGGIKPTRDVL